MLYCDAETPHMDLSEEPVVLLQGHAGCDGEGCLRLFDLPTPEQADLIRKAIELKRRKLHPGNVSHLKFAPPRRGGFSVAASAKAKGGVIVHSGALEQKLARTPLLARLRNNA